MGEDEDSQYAILHMNRYYLIPIGIWLLPSNAPLIFRLLERVAILLCCGLIGFEIVPTLLHIILEEPNPAIKLQLFAPINFNITALGKYCSLLNTIKGIGECFDHIEEDWKYYKKNHATAELSVMRKKAKVGQFLTFFCAISLYGGGFFYNAIMPLSPGRIATTSYLERLESYKSRNSTDLDTHSRPPRVLAQPVYERLINIEEGYRYEFLFLVQLVTSYFVCNIMIGVCSLAAGFVVHVCAQLEIIMNLLDDFVHGNDAGSKEKMKEIIDKHVRALTFAMEVEKNMNVICFIEFTGCTLNICFVGYLLIMEWESRNTIGILTYCNLSIASMFSTFIFCYIGEILTKQCEKVGDIAYAIDWYKLPGKKAVDLAIIINMASCYPARITAGKIVYLSLSSFCNVVKTAAAYVNLLRTVMV